MSAAARERVEKRVAEERRQDDAVLSSIINAAGRIEQLERLQGRLRDLGEEFIQLLCRERWSEDVDDWGLWFEDNTAGGETVNLSSDRAALRSFDRRLGELIEAHHSSLDALIYRAYADLGEWVIKVTGNPPKPTAVPALDE